MLNLDYVFPTPIWWMDTDIDCSKMQDIAYDIAQNMDGKGRSNRGAMNYQSPDFFGEEIIKEDDDDEFCK